MLSLPSSVRAPPGTYQKGTHVSSFTGAAQSTFFPVWLLIAVPLSSSGFHLHGSP